MTSSLSSVTFIALFIETLAYGLALAMGFATVMVLSRLDAEGVGRHLHLIVVLCLMLMVATPHIVVSFIRAFRAFVLAPMQGAGNPDENIFNEDFLLSAKNALFVLQTLLGDSVNIWRFYVIYHRKLKHIIPPCTMMISGFVCGCITVTGPAHMAALFTSIGRWAEAYESLMMLTNIYCTAAISYRISRSPQFRARDSPARAAFVLIAETGLLYTSNLALCLALYVAKSPATLIAIDLVLPLVPCIFCFMILQAQLGRAAAGADTDAAVFSIETLRADDLADDLRADARAKDSAPVSLGQVQIAREGVARSRGKDAVLGIHPA